MDPMWFFVFSRTCIIGVALGVCTERKDYADIESMMVQYIGDWCHMNDPWRYYTEDAQVDFYGIEVCFPV